MAFRADIIAGRAVIVVSIQDTIDRQLRTIRNKLFAFSNTVQKIGRDLTLFGAAGSFGAFFPIKEFTTFQDAMLFVETKLKDTGVNVKALESQIRELGRTTTFTSQQVAEAAAVLAQAGLGERVGPTLLPTLDLARGARIDLDTSGRILANTMSAFDISANRADEIASKLITAARLGTTDVVLLGESLKESLTTFRQLGVPLEDALGLITQLSNVSLRATKAGTSLNTAFANLASKQEELAAIGISITQDDLSKPLNIFTKLSKALEDFTPQEQVSTLQDLFNIRGGRGFGGILVQDLEKLEDIINQIKASTDEARESARLLDSQLGGVGRRLRSAFQETLITIGETTEGPLSILGEELRKLFNNLGAAARANPEFVQTLLLIPPAALAVGAALLGVSLIAGRLGLVIAPLISLNNALFTSLKKVASVNLGLLGGAGKLALSPGRSIAATVARDNERLAKAQAQIARATRATDVTKGIRAAKAAEAARSVFTRPIPAAKFFLDIIQRINRALSGSPIRVGPGAAGLAGSFGFPGAGPTGIGQSPFAPLSARLGFGQTSSPEIDNIRKAATRQMTVYNAALVSASKKAPSSISTNLFDAATTVEGKVVPKIAGATKEASKFGAVFRRVSRFLQIGFANSLIRIANILGKVLSGARGPARSLFNIDYVRGLFKTFQFIGGALRGFFTILNGIRRFVFSAGGILTIIEFLIIAGPKIPPIKTALDALGKGISDFFRRLGQTGQAVRPFFADLLTGLRELATGNSQQGLLQVKNSLASIAEVIFSGLSLAWNDFLDDVEKGVNFLKRSFEGLQAIFSGFGSFLGAAAETGFASRTSGGPGSVGAAEDGGDGGLGIVESFVSGFIGALKAVGSIIIRIISGIRVILVSIFQALRSIVRNIANSRLFGSPDTRKAAAQAQLDFEASRSSNPERFRQLAEQRKFLDQFVQRDRLPTAQENARLDSILQGRSVQQGLSSVNRELASLLGKETRTTGDIVSDFNTTLDRIFDDFVNRNPVKADVAGAEAELADAEARARGRESGRRALLGLGVGQQLGEMFGGIASNAATDIAAEINRGLLRAQNVEDAKEKAQERERVFNQSQRFAKAVVGTFNEVQGQRLQAITREANKVRDELLGQINDGVDNLNNNFNQRQPFVFQ